MTALTTRTKTYFTVDKDNKPIKKKRFDNPKDTEYYTTHKTLPLKERLKKCFSDYPHLYDLLSRMLAWNPAERITPEEALAHPFFKIDCDGE